MDIKGYRIKSFLTEIRYPPRLRMNADIGQIVDTFPPENIAFLQSGGINGTTKSQSSEYTIEFNRSYFLAENIENLAQLDSWIQKSSKLLNQVVNHWQIPTVERLGIRFHLMPVIADTKEHPHQYFAQLLGQGFDLIRSGAITNTVFTSGFVFRFKSADWGVRFGSFSSDADVMRKYHKYHPESSADSPFYKPGLVYDIDCFQEKIRTGHGEAEQSKMKFDITAFIQGAHKLSGDLVQKHVESLKSTTA